MMNPKPVELMIIGAQKAGSTSLIKYLGQHPHLCPNLLDEMVFFIQDRQYKLGYEKIFPRYFKHCCSSKTTLIAKNVQILYSRLAIKRLQEHNPDIKIVVMLRNPVDRAYSAYWHARRIGWESINSFEKAINADPRRFRNRNRRAICAYLDGSIYHKYLKIVMKYFTDDQVQIYLLDDLINNPLKVCRYIFESINVNPDFAPSVTKRHNIAGMPRFPVLGQLLFSENLINRIGSYLLQYDIGYKIRKKIALLNKSDSKPPKISTITRRRLLEFFAPHNQILSEMIGRDLSHWNNI